MTYKDTQELLQGRCLNRRKVGNNTYLERRGEKVAVKLHDTDILTYSPNGRIDVNTGGWQTRTTKDRLNNYLPYGHWIKQERSQWFWNTGAAYTDGDYLNAKGELKTLITAKDLKRRKELRKQIDAYAKGFAAALPVENPGLGDCMFCRMFDPEGSGDTSHLISHMEEEYYVPSLLVNALKFSGSGQYWYWAAFNNERENGICESFTHPYKTQYVRFIKKWMNHCFGIPS